MAYIEIQQRLGLLQDSLKQTSQLIVRLAKSQSSNNALETTTSGNSSTNSLDAQTSVSSDIHEALKQCEEDLELLQQDIEDFAPVSTGTSSFRRTERTSVRYGEKEREHAQLSATYNRLAEELKTARVRFRKAQMQAKRNADRAQEREQVAYLEDLRASAASYTASLEQEGKASEPEQSYSEMRSSLFGSRRGGRGNANSTKDDMLLTASSDLTASLRQTHDLLTSEVSRSRFAHETLASSNKALEELNTRYGSLDDLLSKSRGLLGSLLRSQKSDTWYLETALYILLACLCWLLFRRLFYGPMWWLVWQPLRVVLRVFSPVLSIFGIVSHSTSAVVGSSSSSLVASTSAITTAIGVSEAAHVEARTVDLRNDGDRGSSSHVPYSDYAAGVADSTKVASTTRAQETGTGKDADITPDKGDDLAEKKREEGNDGQAQQREPIRRGDGEVLKERDHEKEPPNPKKRMFEEPAVGQKDKDEL